MGDIGRVASYVALLGAVLALLAGCGALVLPLLLAGASSNPTIAVVSMFKVGAIGGGVSLAYGIVAGLIVAVARRVPLPGRRIAVAAMVFVVGLSPIGEDVFAVAYAATPLPRLDGFAELIVRAAASAIVALVAWQEMVGEQSYEYPNVVTFTQGGAGRTQRR